MNKKLEESKPVKNIVEQGVSKVEACERALRTAKEELNALIENAPANSVYTIDGVGYQVIVNKEGKQVLNCLMNKRAIAFLRGEPVKPVVRRARKEKKTT